MSDQEKLTKVKCPLCREAHEKMIFWTGNTTTIWIYCAECKDYLNTYNINEPEPHSKNGKFWNWI